MTYATLPLHSIRVRENVRELDSDHVASLAQSIKLRGLLPPLRVRRIRAMTIHKLTFGLLLRRTRARSPERLARPTVAHAGEDCAVA